MPLNQITLAYFIEKLEMSVVFTPSEILVRPIVCIPPLIIVWLFFGPKLKLLPGSNVIDEYYTETITIQIIAQSD